MNRRHLLALSMLLVVAPFGPSGTTRCWALVAADSLTTTLLPTSALTVEKASNDNTPAGALAIAADKAGPSKQVYLKFNRQIIPKGACVTEWTIRLYKSAEQKEYQYVQAFPVKFSPPFKWENKPELSLKNVSPVATTRVTSGLEKVDLIHNVTEDRTECQWREESDDLSVVLLTETPVKNIFHGLADSCQPLAKALSPCNTQPRLVVSYYMKASPPPNEAWLENDYDSQHSGRTIWKTQQDVKEITRKKLYEPACGTGYITEGVAPLIGQSQIIVNTQLAKNGGPYEVTAVGGDGQVAWHTPVCEPAARAMAIDKLGRLYVATINCLLVLDAGRDHTVLKNFCWTDGSPSCSADEKDLFKLKNSPPAAQGEKPVEAISVSAPPTIGDDGLIYLSTNRGVFALTPYPDLKVLWRFTGGGGFGPVALSPDGRSAYVVEKELDVNGSTPAGPLIAIDTTDGSRRWSAGSFHPGKFPTPVVASWPDKKKELVYAVDQFEVNAAGKYTEKHLEVFDRGLCEKSPTPAECLTTPVNEGWVSQPVLAGAGETYGAYFVRGDRGSSKGKLCRYSGYEESKPACATSGADDLSPLSMLAADGKGNIYVLDGFAMEGSNQIPQKVRGYTPGFAQLLSLPVPGTYKAVDCQNGPKESTNLGGNIMVGADGTLYNSNANVLVAFRPTLPGSSLGVEISKQMQGDSDNATAFAAHGKITLSPGQSNEPNATPSIRSGRSFVLESASGIGFQPGVIVQKGAQLNCRIEPRLK